MSRTTSRVLFVGLILASVLMDWRVQRSYLDSPSLASASAQAIIANPDCDAGYEAMAARFWQKGLAGNPDSVNTRVMGVERLGREMLCCDTYHPNLVPSSVKCFVVSGDVATLPSRELLASELRSIGGDPKYAERPEVAADHFLTFQWEMLSSGDLQGVNLIYIGN